MPNTNPSYQIKDLPRLNDPNQLLGKIFEVEDLTNGENSGAGVPLLAQAVQLSLPASTKLTHIQVSTFDATDPHYVPGEPTLVSESLRCDLVMWMTAFVEFPNQPSRTYQLQYDPAGQYLAYKNTTFTGQQLPGKWVDVTSKEAAAAGIADFTPLTTKYAQGATVKYQLAGAYRIFAAKQELLGSSFNNSLPAPTGLSTDPYWAEVNGEPAPNYSREGQLACRYYTVAERDAADPTVGDTVEELIARENAGAGILYANRTVTVELGSGAGAYRVAYDGSGAAPFLAYVDGSFRGGQNPSKLAPVSYGDVTKAYVDAADQALQTQVTASATAIATEKNRMDMLLASGNAPIYVNNAGVLDLRLGPSLSLNSKDDTVNVSLTDDINDSRSFRVPSLSAVRSAIAAAGSSGHGSSLTLGTTATFTAAQDGAQNFNLPTAVAGFIQVCVQEPNGAVRVLFPGDYDTSTSDDGANSPTLFLNENANVAAGDLVAGTYYVTGSGAGNGGSGTADQEDLLLYTPDSATRVVPLALLRPLTLVAVSAIAARNVGSITFQVNTYDVGTNAWHGGVERTSVAAAQADLDQLTQAQRDGGAELLFKVAALDNTKPARGVATIIY